MTTTLRRGVTLIELILVIGLLLILAALLLPAVGKVRVAAGRTQSVNHLKMLGISIHNFNDTFRNLPPIIGKANNQYGSLLFHLLPYMELDNLYRRAKGQSWNVADAVVPIYLDPQDHSLPKPLFQDSLAVTNYAGSYLGFGDGTHSIPATFQDGTSNTMMFTTRLQVCDGTPTVWAYSTIAPQAPMFGYYSYAKFQVNPKQEECDPHVPQAIGPVIAVSLCDGSVRTLTPAISPRTWHHALTPAGGEVLDADW